MMQGAAFPFGSGESHIEQKHPHIVDRLRLLWGYPEGSRYLASLLVDARGDRAGFSREVFSELITLVNRYPAPTEPETRFRAQPTVPMRKRAGFDESHGASRRRVEA